MTRARRVFWVPSLLVGAAVATALATSASVLLYDAQGLYRAAAVLSGVATVSIVAGLRMGAADYEETVPSAARWWVGLLVTLLIGAGFSALWEKMGGFGSAAAAQGLGLALTAALPAYFAGGVWGLIGGFAGSLGTGVKRQVAFGGLLGVVAGSSLVIAMLGRPVLAVTAFMGAVVFASAGARCQGWIFDRVPRRRLVLDDPARPELHFEAWYTAVPETAVRVLMDGGRDRVVDPAPAGDWRLGVAGTLDSAHPVLFVGAGSWFTTGGDREWYLYEPDAGLRALAARGFGWDKASVAVSPIPRSPGYTVVADWEAMGVIAAHTVPAGALLAELREAHVARVWIFGPRGRIPASLMESASNGGYRVARYGCTVAGATGPPDLPPWGDELWCLDRSAAPPGAVPGMELLPADDEASGGRDAR